jgi:hypothetical protein
LSEDYLAVAEKTPLELHIRMAAHLTKGGSKHLAGGVDRSIRSTIITPPTTRRGGAKRRRLRFLILDRLRNLVGLPRRSAPGARDEAGSGPAMPEARTDDSMVPRVWRGATETFWKFRCSQCDERWAAFGRPPLGFIRPPPGGGKWSRPVEQEYACPNGCLASNPQPVGQVSSARDRKASTFERSENSFGSLGFQPGIQTSHGSVELQADELADWRDLIESAGLSDLWTKSLNAAPEPTLSHIRESNQRAWEMLRSVPNQTVIFSPLAHQLSTAMSTAAANDGDLGDIDERIGIEPTPPGVHGEVSSFIQWIQEPADRAAEITAAVWPASTRVPNSEYDGITRAGYQCELGLADGHQTTEDQIDSWALKVTRGQVSSVPHSRARIILTTAMRSSARVQLPARFVQGSSHQAFVLESSTSSILLFLLFPDGCTLEELEAHFDANLLRDRIASALTSADLLLPEMQLHASTRFGGGTTQKCSLTITGSEIEVAAVTAVVSESGAPGEVGAVSATVDGVGRSHLLALLERSSGRILYLGRALS